MTYIKTTDFFLEVKKGNVSKHSSYKIAGVNPDIDSSEEFINSIAALALPTTYRTHAIVSNSANDTSAGTGARTIEIKGNTSIGIESEIITMNGTTPVNTSKQYDFILELEVLTAGSGTTNAGIITATADIDSTVTISMPSGQGEEYNGAFKCPVGYTGYLMRWWGDFQNSVANTLLDFNLYKRKSGGAWHVEDHAKSVNQGDSSFIKDFSYSPIELSSGEIFAIKGTSSNNNSDVGAGFIILLIQS